MTGGTAVWVSGGTPSGWAGSIDLYVYYKVLSQSIEDNTSTLSFGMYVTTPSGWDIGNWRDYYGSYIGTATSGDNCISFDGSIPAAFAGTCWVAEDITLTIPHNTDGSKAATIYWKWGCHSGWSGILNAPSGSFSITLPTIPRAAQIVSAPNFTDEDNPTITYNNSAGSVVDKIEACISFTGAKDDVPYREISKTKSSYTFNLTDAERQTLRNGTLSGSNSRTVAFYLKTTIGSNVYYSALIKTFVVINAEPQLSVLAMDVNEATTALTGDSLTTVIKGYSAIGYEMNATALKGASIQSYRASDGSNVINTDSGTFNGVQSTSFTFAATDNRGLTTTVSRNFLAIDYIKPSCDVEVTLELDGESTAKATCELEGNYFNGSFGLVDNSLKIEVLHTGLTDWVELTDGLIPILDGNTYTFTFTATGLDYTKPFKYQFRVSDALDSVTTAENSKSIYPVFDWSAEDFNFNVPISMNGNQTIRATDTGRVVISGNDGDIYLRPNGSTTDAGQLRITTTGLALLDGVRLATVDMIYPVGSIYMSVNSTNPSNFLGGSWERIQDRFLLAAGSSYSAGATGGEASHKLTANEMPSHKHTTFERDENASSYASYRYMVDTYGTGSTAYGFSPSMSAVTGRKQMETGSIGGGAAHNNMPPYLAVYVWKRTA